MSGESPMEVVIEGVEPPLLVRSDRPLSAEDAQRINEGIAECLNRGGPTLIVSPGLEIYQRVNGQWQPLPERKADAPTLLDGDANLWYVPGVMSKDPC